MGSLAQCPPGAKCKLRIFTDREFLLPGQLHVMLLEAFWGQNTEYQTSPAWADRLTEYCAQASESFSLTTAENADAFLFPAQWNPGGDNHHALRLARLAEEAGKPIVVFCHSDSDDPILISNAIIFRTSIISSLRRRNEFAMPGWSCDLLKVYAGGVLQVRTKKITPTVAYTGYVPNSLDPLSLARHFARRIKHPSRPGVLKGAALRGRATRVLGQTDGVATNFNFTRSVTAPTAATEDSRRRYAENILDSDYGLVVRGSGNFSYRLYEVMSCGRIPLFVDTECVLPFDDVLDWRRLAVWVEERDIRRIGERLIEFHQGLSERDFADLQATIRRTYEEWLSPLGFHSNLHRYIGDRAGRASSQELQDGVPGM